MLDKKRPTLLSLAIVIALFCSLCGNLIQYINATPKTKPEQHLSQLEYIIPDGFTHYSEDGKEGLRIIQKMARNLLVVK